MVSSIDRHNRQFLRRAHNRQDVSILVSRPAGHRDSPFHNTGSSVFSGRAVQPRLSASVQAFFANGGIGVASCLARRLLLLIRPYFKYSKTSCFRVAAVGWVHADQNDKNNLDCPLSMKKCTMCSFFRINARVQGQCAISTATFLVGKGSEFSGAICRNSKLFVLTTSDIHDLRTSDSLPRYEFSTGSCCIHVTREINTVLY